MAESFPALDEAFRRRIQIPLAEVANLTGYPLRSLLDDCRADRVDHIRRHGKYFMTRAQVEKLTASNSRKAVPGARPRSTGVTADSAVDVEAWKARKRAQLARKAG
jgi:lactam utilization protein B